MKSKNLLQMFDHQKLKSFFTIFDFGNKFYILCVCNLRKDLEINIFEEQVFVKAKNIFLLGCLSLFLCSCTRGIDLGAEESMIGFEDEFTLEEQAELALINFYTFLYQGKYDLAADLYGGSYDILLGYNPSLEEANKEGLLRAACERNGFMCLETLSTESMQAVDQGEFIYEVKYANPDGSEFVLGPCCSASEEEMPPKSIFAVHVQCEHDGTCLVLDLPPYVP